MKDNVQSWWEIPAICYYCSLLGNGFGIPEFSVERLEEALLNKDDDVLLIDIFDTLTKGILPDSPLETWREKVHVLFDEHNKTNPFNKQSITRALTPWQKLDILYSLCEIRLECNDVNSVMKTVERWQLDVLPAGEDRGELIYWYFTGTRVYRQDRSVGFIEKRKSNRKTRKEPEMYGLKRIACQTLLKMPETPRSNLIKNTGRHWQVVTSGLSETIDFSGKFESSTLPEEETLYRNLVKVVIPKIRSAVEDEERKALMAGERKGITRSGRKIVSRFKAQQKDGDTESSSDSKSDSSKKDKRVSTVTPTRQSKRKRTQPPLNTVTPARRNTRSTSEIPSPPPAAATITPVRSTRVTRRSSQLEGFTTPPDTDSDEELIRKAKEEREREKKAEQEGAGYDDDKENEKENEEEEEEEEEPPVVQVKKRTSLSTQFYIRKRGKRPGKPPRYLQYIENIEKAVAFRQNLHAKERKEVVSAPRGADIELHSNLYKVIATLMAHPEAWQFNDPVKEEHAPHYYVLIENPRDFSEIEKKVMEYKYPSLMSFIEEINLVFTNCYDFNGPLNEYTKAARLLERYYRDLMKLVFPDYKFSAPSVINPHVRPFVNRHKRIKELKLAGKLLPQPKPMDLDESSKESTDTPPPPAKKSGEKRRKGDDTPVSFTQLLSDNQPNYTTSHQQYPSYYGYHFPYPPGGYHVYYTEPYHQRALYVHHPPHPSTTHIDTNSNTYIELAPRTLKQTKRITPATPVFKHDEEPLLFPLLPRYPLPRSSLTTSRIPEELILKDLLRNQPSQINSIDSTTSNSENESEEKSSEAKQKTPRNMLNGDSKKEDVQKPDSSTNPELNNHEGEKPSANGTLLPAENVASCTTPPLTSTSNSATSTTSVAKSATSTTLASSTTPPTIPTSVPSSSSSPATLSPPCNHTATSTTPPPHSTLTSVSATTPTATPQSLNNEAVAVETSEALPKQIITESEKLLDPIVPPTTTKQTELHYPTHNAGNIYNHNQVHHSMYNYHGYYNNGYPNNYRQVPRYYPQYDPYHGHSQDPHAYHYQRYFQTHNAGYVNHGYGQYAPSPLLGDDSGLFRSRSKQITATSRARGSRKKKSRAALNSPVIGSPPVSPHQSPPPSAVVNGTSKVRPPTPPRDSKKQKKMFDVRMPPKKTIKN